MRLRPPSRPPGSVATRKRSTELTRNLGFLLARASQRWNEVLAAAFAAAGHVEVRPAYGAILIPLFVEDGLQMTELGRRARLTKQTMTTMVRAMEAAGLVKRRPDPSDARATRIFLTDRSRRFESDLARVLQSMDLAARRRLGALGLDRVIDGLVALQDLDKP